MTSVHPLRPRREVIQTSIAIDPVRRPWHKALPAFSERIPIVRFDRLARSTLRGSLADEGWLTSQPHLLGRLLERA